MRHANQRRGVAMVLAIVLLSLTSIATASSVYLIHRQIARTQEQVQEARLRQLLLDGAQIVQARLQSSIDVAAPIVLPAELSDLQLDIGKTPTPGRFQITARYQSHMLSQEISLSNSGGHWVIASATLSR